MLLASTLLLAFNISGFAQELKSKVTINTDRIEGVDKNAFDDLAQKLTSLINDSKWTNYSYAPIERIQCDFAINILSAAESNKYEAELVVTAQRPVYNASYNTTLLIFRDKNLNFEYQPFEQIQYSSQAPLENNLTASIVFYVYLVLTLDADSFSPLGGNIYRNELMQIVNKAASSQPNWKGWSSNDGNLSRYALAEALNDPSLDPFRQYWYLYHRKGLDELVGNLQRGRTNILDNLKMLDEAWKNRPMSPLFTIFSDTKLKELVEIAKDATASEKKAAFTILNKIYPTEGEILSQLKR